eukprot:TRINITY_DN76040_c0_g1_i1.p1 TRINITY_DN76040_c0_g1~~TRINITY_DN76040_c0_g1_i1.p1  ORF type:complete len:345 (+),score=47.35 TRINITY_DN76040_c0_g1_i1:20-1054(+)
MPPKKAVKRPAAVLSTKTKSKEQTGTSAAGVDTKASPIPQQVKRKCAIVSKFLDNLNDVIVDESPEWRNALEGSLGLPRSQRGTFQHRVVETVSNAFARHEAKLQRASETGPACDESYCSSMLQSAQAYRFQAEASAQQDFKTVVEAENALAEATRALQTWDKFIADAPARRDALNASARNYYEPLRSGKAKASHFDDLLKSLRENSDDYQLIPSEVKQLRSVFSKDPAKRSQQDTASVRRLGDLLEHCVSAISLSILQGTAKHAELSMTVQNARAALALAQTRRAQSKARLDAAERAIRDREKVVMEAHEATKVNKAERAAAKAELEAFRRGPRAVFNDLKDR